VPDAPKPEGPIAPAKTNETVPEIEQVKGATIVSSDGSSVTDNRYENPYFGFTFDFPRDWHVLNNAAAKKVLEENGRKMAAGNPALEAEAKKPDVSTPLLAVSEPTPYKNSPVGRTFKILASDVSAEKQPVTAEAYANALASMAKEGKMPFELLSGPERVTINGNKMAKLYLKLVFEGTTYYAVMWAVPKNQYMLQFMATSPEKDGLTDLEPVMQSLHFRATATHP
jgi:hypothetical protein